MRTGADTADRTAPDTASGAVPVPALRAGDFWRALAASVLATLAPWQR